MIPGFPILSAFKPLAIKILGGSVVLLLGVLLITAWKYERADSDRDQLKGQVTQLKLDLEGANDEVDRINELRRLDQKTLANVKRDKQDIQRAADNWSRRYHEALEHSEESRDVANTRIPGPLLSVLRAPVVLNEEGSGEGSSTDSADESDESTTVSGPIRGRFSPTQRDAGDSDLGM